MLWETRRWTSLIWVRVRDEGVLEAFDLGRDGVGGDFTARDDVPGAMQ